jgi:O-antigen/teichoic acid export membrane protein
MFNAASSYGAMGVSSAITILLIPFIIGQLGKEMYGVVILVQSLQFLIDVCGSGLSQAVCRMYSICLVNSDENELNSYYTNCLFLITSIIIPFTVIIALALIFLALPRFNIAPEQIHAAKILMGLIFGCSLATFLSVPHIGICAATQRFYMQNLCSIFSQTVWAILVVFFLYNWPSLVSLGGAYLIGRVIYFLASVVVSKKILPGFKFLVMLIDFKKIRNILSISVRVLVTNLSNSAYMQFNQMIINAFLGPVYNTYFAVCFVWNTLSSRLLDVVGTVIAPQITTFQVKKQWNAIGQSLVRSTKYGGIAGMPIAAVLGVLAGPIFSVWLSDGYEKSIRIMPWFALAIPITASQVPPVSMLIALGKYKLPSIVAPVIAAANLIVVLICVGWYGLGLESIAITLFVFVFIRLAIIYPLYAARVCRVSITKYFLESYFRNILTIIPVLAILFLAKAEIAVWNLHTLVGVIVIAVIVYLLSCWFIALDQWDKNLIITHLISLKTFLLKNRKQNVD